MCTVRLRCKDKTAKCRFSLVPGDGPVLLGMPDIEVLNIPRIICEGMGGIHKSRIFNSQKMEASNSPSCKVNKPHRSKKIIWM